MKTFWFSIHEDLLVLYLTVLELVLYVTLLNAVCHVVDQVV